MQSKYSKHRILRTFCERFDFQKGYAVESYNETAELKLKGFVLARLDAQEGAAVTTCFAQRAVEILELLNVVLLNN